MKKYIMKLQRHGSHSYNITVPKELVKKFGWREKQKLELIHKGRKEQIIIQDWVK